MADTLPTKAELVIRLATELHCTTAVKAGATYAQAREQTQKLARLAMQGRLDLTAVQYWRATVAEAEAVLESIDRMGYTLRRVEG